MESDIALQLIILIVLIVLSGFFSSAETALTACSRIKMRTLADGGDKRAQRVMRLAEDQGRMLSTILVGNNIVNLSASAIAASMAMGLGGSAAVGIATAILTVVLLVFGEIAPKTMASLRPDSIALAYSGVLEALMVLLTPIVFVMHKLSGLVLFLMRANDYETETGITEDELRTMVDVSHEEGVIEQEERQMINNVFDFGDTQARDVMVPRVDMIFADIDSDYEKLLEIFRTDHFTRLPVYEDSTDNVVGIINMKDLLLCEDTAAFSIRDIMREPYYTYEHKNTAELLLEMRKSSINIAIVLDEYGSTAGLITLEDLLEEIVGEIRDEYDEDEEDPVTKLSDSEYIVQGSLNLTDLNDMLGLSLTSEDYDSVGGYIIGNLDHVPEPMETFVTPEGISLRVEEMDKNRIHKVRLALPES